ncbi:MAG: AAA family ATPase, partial [Clostridiaceae bacterium]|nr:AAA family ATPase [Clostridiaceae bacterium]
VLKTVLEVYQKLYDTGKILLAAPTGRASRRMAESTGFSQAQTLHSALGLLGEDAENSFRNRTGLLEADLIIVDEISMMDMWLAKQLFTRIKQGTKILLVGDADQLPSVGAGNVFRELISCGLIPVTVLDEIFRQAKDSLIAHNAKFVNEAKTSLYYGNDFVFIKCKTQPEAAAAIQRIYFDEIAKSSIEQVQILSPFRSDGEASAEKLNEVIRERVNPAAEGVAERKIGLRIFRVNDRVMQTKNKGEISNGDVGFIREVQKDSSGADRILIEFTDNRAVEYSAEDMGTIELAYAMTVHKAMGSEYDTVIIPILSAHTILLYRNLVYTAITRAKRRVFLVGQKDVLFMAIHRTKIDKRNTLLGQRIALYHKAFIKKRQDGQVA